MLKVTKGRFDDVKMIFFLYSWCYYTLDTHSNPMALDWWENHGIDSYIQQLSIANIVFSLLAKLDECTNQ